MQISKFAKISLFCMMPLLASCIDENLKDCGYDTRVIYNLCLKLDIDTYLQPQLTQPEEQDIRELLGNALAPVFDNHATDLELHFYNDGILNDYVNHIINDNQASYTIYMHPGEYRHHALANQMSESSVRKENETMSATHQIVTENATRCISQSRGIFSARKDMTINNQESTCNVQLYMVNCATAVVVDLDGTKPEKMWCLTEGFADRFLVDDSVYVAEQNHSISTIELSDNNQRRCFYAVHLPSADIDSRSTGSWKARLYVQIAGKVTESVLTVPEPVLPGTLQLLKLKLDEQGCTHTDKPNVGISVTLDWKEGSTHEPEID